MNKLEIKLAKKCKIYRKMTIKPIPNKWRAVLYP